MESIKKFESLKNDNFSKFKTDEMSSLSVIIGGERGNTRGGYDYRDKCTKRKCDKVSNVCEDVDSVAVSLTTSHSHSHFSLSSSN